MSRPPGNSLRLGLWLTVWLEASGPIDVTLRNSLKAATKGQIDRNTWDECYNKVQADLQDTTASFTHRRQVVIEQIDEELAW